MGTVLPVTCQPGVLPDAFGVSPHPKLYGRAFCWLYAEGTEAAPFASVILNRVNGDGAPGVPGTQTYVNRNVC